MNWTCDIIIIKYYTCLTVDSKTEWTSIWKWIIIGDRICKIEFHKCRISFAMDLLLIWIYLIYRKRLTNVVESWWTTIVRDTVFKPCKRICLKNETMLKWWEAENNWKKRNGHTKYWTVNYTMNCPPYTILEFCFWWPIYKHYFHPNKSSTLKRQRYIITEWCQVVQRLMLSNIYMLGICRTRSNSGQVSYRKSKRFVHN